MTWEKAEELVTVLRGQGKSDKEIISKLIQTTDRYRESSKRSSDRLSEVKQELIQLKKDCGRIIQVEVDKIQRYGFRKVVWYKGKPYQYRTKRIWTPIPYLEVPNIWPDETQYGKIKVWIELHEDNRDVICKGITMGFVNGMTCISLDSQTQPKMYLNHGDEVTVTKVRKNFKS